MSDKKWLTLEEVALRLHVHIVTARRYVREGMFPASQIGKQYLIPEAAVEELLQKNLRLAGNGTNTNTGIVNGLKKSDTSKKAQGRRAAAKG